MQSFFLSADGEAYGTLRDNLAFTKGLDLSWITHPAMLANTEMVHDQAQIIVGYHEIKSRVIAQSPSPELRSSIAIVDLRDHAWNGLTKLNPLSETDGTWPVIVSMLILAFPEIQWIFYDAANSNLELSLLFRQTHFCLPDLKSALDIREEGLVPLFDPTGLRQIIRSELKGPTVDDNTPLAHIPVRHKVAASIDDEKPFAYFNAHAAYRFGYRSHVVTSFKMMERLFRPLGNAEHITLVFEDLSLSFADKPPKGHYFKLPDRDHDFPLLLEVDSRVFVTVGAEDKRDEERLNAAYLRYQSEKSECEGNTRFLKMVFKPLAGFFDLQHQASLANILGWPPNRQVAALPASVSHRPNRSDRTPPRDAAIATGWRHGIPGRILFVAEDLVYRAEVLLKSGLSVEDCIHGTVLALDALELAGNRTPTLAIQALALKHELELSAECMFYGLRSNLEIKSRLAEVAKEVDWVAERFYYQTRDVSSVETQISIVNRLTKILRDNGRFDEEQSCMETLRTLRRKLWLKKRKWSKPLFSVGWPFRWYADTLIHSPKTFLLAILGWLSAITVFYLFTDNKIVGHNYITLPTLGRAFFHAVENFISAHPPDTSHELHDYHRWPVLLYWMTPIILMLGFFHAGILVAYLYSTIVRKIG
jgi:hypothetical protein